MTGYAQAGGYTRLTSTSVHEIVTASTSFRFGGAIRDLAFLHCEYVLRAGRMTGMRKLVGSTAVAVSLALLPASGAADPADQLTLGLGAFDAFDTDDLSAEGLAEYRFGERMFEENFGRRFRGLRPMVGIRANTDGGVTGYGSIFADIRPFERWYLWPSAGIAGYREGDSRDLGGVFQFHLGVAAGYRVTDRTRIGIAYQHVSNAGIHDQNPGANSLFLTVTFELSPLD